MEAVMFLTLAFGLASGLYEDQIGQFDWRRSLLGRIRHVQFDQSTYSTKRVILATESNVLASINARTGQIIWRRVLEVGGRVNSLLHHNGVLISVSLGGSLIRSWDPSTGQLLWEASQGSPSEDSAEASLVSHSQGKGFLVLVLSGGWLHAYGHSKGKEMWAKDLNDGRSWNGNDNWSLHVSDDVVVVATEVAASSLVLHWVNGSDGADVRPRETVSAPWLLRRRSRCVFTDQHYFVCIDGQLGTMHSLDVHAEKPSFSPTLLDGLDVHLHSNAPFSLESFGSDLLLTSSASSVLLGFVASSKAPVVRKRFSIGTKVYRGSLADVVILFLLKQDAADTLEVRGIDAETLEETAGIGQTVSVPSDLGNLEMAYVYMFHKKDKTLAYRMLLATSDDALSLVQQNGRVTWTREESLADIGHVQMIDLPISEGKTYLEGLYRDLTFHSGNPLTLFMRRISAQLAHLQVLSSSFNGHNTAADDETGPAESLTRDKFNLRKLILILTSAGKLLGIDSESGKFLWKLFLPDLGRNAMMVVQRTTDCRSLPPQVAVIGTSKSNCEGSIVFTVDPMTGRLSGNEGRYHCLGYAVKHAFLLPVEDEDSTRITMLTDTENRAYLFPSTQFAAKSVKNHPQAVHVHSIYQNESKIVGYKAEFVSAESWELRLTDTWTVQLPSDRKIINYAARPAHERVNDQARILGNRSALYKYLNPNLLVIATEIEAEKGAVEILILDGVTGSIVHRVKQRQARGPVHVVHSENWIVYSLWNARARRNEVSVLEMFESGSWRRNETHVSSLDVHGPPQVLRKSFVFPTAIRTMGVTLTERGITSKGVLFGLHNGTIFAVPKALLDPRRPLVPKASDSEEGLFPYIPILFLSPRSFINYNQTVHNIDGLITVPAGLESTCLLFAHGLDLFFTRMTPSRKFDVLADDFDSKLIITVLLGLASAAFLAGRLAKRKRSQSAWK